MPYSQLGQDTWVLSQFPMRDATEKLFYLEIGAHDGTALSNTRLLEEHGWSGLSVDPFPTNWADRRTTVVREVVAETEGPVQFVVAGALGGIEGYQHPQFENDIKDKEVVTLDAITPAQLLKKYHVPHTIHYMSVDVEGTELEILRAFPFDDYDVHCLTVEHNFLPQRDEIKAVLHRHGFERVREVAWDDYYKKRE
jgi:hypothetical protein